MSGVLAIATSFSQAGQATPKVTANQSLDNNALIALQFQPPGDSAPNTSIGGGTRGKVTFAAPGDSAPTTSTGGASRGKVTFAAPGDSAPRTSTGGASRGEVTFAPPGDSAPNTSAGGGTRNERLPALTALLPDTNYGQTIASRPTFFVYLPPTASTEVFFSLQDENRNHHYQTTIEVSGEGGIVSVTLPEDAPELEIGKNYAWFFAPIPPGETIQPSSYGVSGWVKRVELPTQISENAATNPVAQATAYAESGIWYDTLAVLAAAQKAQPENSVLVSEWRDLLQQVGLEEIATQPLSER
ncbi:MAG: DUF928 domain-containing protein [Oscillatoria sp. PMC 1076.18]|nr:DUF928 domain-containing protein [Oscillatoria sp. PMC 1076.18]